MTGEEWAGVQGGQRGVETTLIMLSGENKMCVLIQVCPRYVKTHALPSTSCNKQTKRLPRLFSRVSHH